jgi:ubiquinone/menaquinone biosynthesis C-methylase UbiE
MLSAEMLKEECDMSDSKDLSKERYSQYAQAYITSQTHAKGADLDRLLEIAQPQADWLMLDVATGGGHTTLKFAPHVGKVIATDLTPAMLEAAQEHISSKGATNVEFKVADAENLPFDDNTFDLVTCRIAAHHFPNVAQFVAECARVIKPSGMVLIQDHVLPEDRETAAFVDGFEKFRDPSHNHAFPESEWLAMFAAVGLTVVNNEQVVKRHNFLEWAGRQGNSAETIEELVSMLKTAPVDALTWMSPEAWSSDAATFVNRHILIAGRRLSL